MSTGAGGLPPNSARSIGDLLDGMPADPRDRFERCRSETNPFRNAALNLELGPFVCKSLMSQADWREIIEIQLAQLRTVRSV